MKAWERIQPPKEQSGGDKTKAGTKTLYEYAAEKELFCGAFCLPGCAKRERKKIAKKISKREIEKKEQVVFLTVLFLSEHLRGAPDLFLLAFPGPHQCSTPTIPSGLDGGGSPRTWTRLWVRRSTTAPSSLFKRWGEEEAKREKERGRERESNRVQVQWTWRGKAEQAWRTGWRLTTCCHVDLARYYGKYLRVGRLPVHCHCM